MVMRFITRIQKSISHKTRENPRGNRTYSHPKAQPLHGWVFHAFPSDFHSPDIFHTLTSRPIQPMLTDVIFHRRTDQSREGSALLQALTDIC
jgi:hypothetical protein